MNIKERKSCAQRNDNHELRARVVMGIKYG